MNRRMSWRVPALLCTAALLAVLLAGMSLAESERTVLGMPVISEAEYDACKAKGFSDESVHILFDSAPAAVDEQTHTIYIAQEIDAGMTLQDLQGCLSVADAGAALYFVEPVADLNDAVSRGQSYKLVAKNVTGLCTSYNVIFTNLPVASMTTVESTGEDLETVFMGRFVLCDPMDKQLQVHRVTDCTAQWHYRGRSTITADKKSYRVSLKTKTGDKENHQLLDLGYDDDWIVNAVVNDRTRIREHVISELWHQMQQTNEAAVNMSRGRYIEVVCDGVYQGIYLLQRKIDAKFVGLGEEDVLLKGTGNGGGPEGVWSALVADDHGEKLSDTQAHQTAVEFYEDGMEESINPKNWIDVELMVQLGCLRDNQSYKNIYYQLMETPDGREVRLIPWDVDMSFGFRWSDESGFVYDSETVVERIYHRREYAEMKTLYPELDHELALRWKELREQVLTEETFRKIVGANIQQLRLTDAIGRDYEKWSYLYQPEDTVENMIAFYNERLTILDTYYGQFLP